MSPEDELAVAKLVGKRFIARKDVMAIQGATGAYRPTLCNCSYPQKCELHKPEPFTVEAIIDHLRGRRTYGHYMSDPATQKTKLCAFDLDVVKEPTVIKGQLCESPRDAIADPRHPLHYEIMKQLKFLADGLAVRLERFSRTADTPVTTAIAFSGSKGVHVYGWFEAPILVKYARYLAQQTLDGYQCFTLKKGKNTWQHMEHYEAVEIEVFPKQDHINVDGFGNLMRLPLGQNRKTGGRGFFMKVTPHDSNDFTFMPVDPIEVLRSGSL
jgi:hypothetical protein